MNTNPEAPKRAGVYARISVHDKNVPKVENQLEQCRDLCRRETYVVHDTYADDGIAASEGEARPNWQRLLSDLEAGRIDVIVATEQERLTRNNMETQLLIIACVNAGANYHTARGGYVDPSTASGEFLTTLFGAVGRMESKRKAERQRDANIKRRAKGQPYTNCVVPFGWAPDRVTLVEAEADLVRRGTHAVRCGASMHSVLAMFRKSGLRPRQNGEWTNLAVRRLLTRYRNAAVMTFNEVPTGDPATWEPIVTRDEVEEVRDILLSKNGTRAVAKHLLSSIALCSCGSYMVSATMNRVTNYVCAARRLRTIAPGEKHTAIRAEQLDAAARDAVIATYLLTPRASTAGDTEARKLAELHTELRKVRDSQAFLLDAYTDVDVPMTKTVYVRKNAALLARESELTQSIGQAASASAHARMLTETRRLLFSSRRINLRDAAAAKAELADVFDGLDLENRRRLVAATVRIVVNPGRGIERVSVAGHGLPGDLADELELIECSI